MPFALIGGSQDTISDVSEVDTTLILAGASGTEKKAH